MSSPATDQVPNAVPAPGAAPGVAEPALPVIHVGNFKRIRLHLPTLPEASASLLRTIVVALFALTFVLQPILIPSESMEHTLLVGDFLLFNKQVYAPAGSLTHWLMPYRRVQRGDIIVFHHPKPPLLVKRVVGLPGDRIQMKSGILYINDVPVKRERLSDFIGEDPCGSDATARVKRWKETLPNGVSYESLDCVDNGFYDNTNVYTVPPGNFFMMGDNRDNSTDSRVLSAVGYVPFENLVGRAQMIFFSIAEGEHAWMFWRWPTAVRWNRIFKIVR